jgi:tRNA threonylcarbamoyl adenosine modification protein YjeE|tara:strand:+ start:8512 stop:8964 length:453 start_codon:yes stop_codon:yes gene_type:complete
MKISSLEDLENISKKIKKKILPGDCIFLYGEIGVGKTTFSRILINNFEKENNLKPSEVLSPTFNIVFEYEVKNYFIKHYDLYRLKKKEDIINLGIFENKDKNIILVEWPELIENKPINRVDLFFQYTKDMESRTLSIKGLGRFKEYDFEI